MAAGTSLRGQLAAGPTAAGEFPVAARMTRSLKPGLRAPASGSATMGVTPRSISGVISCRHRSEQTMHRRTCWLTRLRSRIVSRSSQPSSIDSRTHRVPPGTELLTVLQAGQPARRDDERVVHGVRRVGGFTDHGPAKPVERVRVPVVRLRETRRVARRWVLYGYRPSDVPPSSWSGEVADHRLSVHRHLLPLAFSSVKNA
jgi:hypothetical protein